VKAVVATSIVVLAVLIHLGAIAFLLSNAGLLAAALVITLFAISHVLPKSSGLGWNLPISRRSLSIGSAVLLIVGTAFALIGFLIAHLYNANIDVLRVCAYPRSGDFICHKIGPVFLLLGLGGGLVTRRLAPSSQN